MQVIFLVLVYFLGAIVNNRPSKKIKSDQTPANINWWGMNFKQVIFSLLAGVIGVMVLDLLSQGEPVWPALALIANVVGEMFPIWKIGMKRRTGVFSFLGGIFYLNPILALFSLGLALEIYWVGKDNLLSILLFVGLIPILMWYSQMNQVFLWTAITAELLVISGLKVELWNKIKPPMKNI